MPGSGMFFVRNRAALRFHILKMALQAYLSLIFAAFGALAFFAPRNAYVGFRSRASLAGDAVWRRTNRAAGGFAAASSCVLLILSSRGISMGAFVAAMGVCAALSCAIARRVSLSPSASADTEKVPGKAAPKKSRKGPKRGGGLVFGGPRRTSVFFCAFCVFLIAASYAWVFRTGEFFPADVFLASEPDGGAAFLVGRGPYMAAVSYIFWGVMALCAAVMVFKANFAKVGTSSAPSPAVSKSDVMFACAASAALAISGGNYAVLAFNTAPGLSADILFSLAAPPAGAAAVWAALFMRDAMLRRNSPGAF